MRSKECKHANYEDKEKNAKRGCIYVSDIGNHRSDVLILRESSNSTWELYA